MLQGALTHLEEAIRSLPPSFDTGAPKRGTRCAQRAQEVSSPLSGQSCDSKVSFLVFNDDRGYVALALRVGVWGVITCRTRRKGRWWPHGVGHGAEDERQDGCEDGEAHVNRC